MSDLTDVGFVPAYSYQRVLTTAEDYKLVLWSLEGTDLQTTDLHSLHTGSPRCLLPHSGSDMVFTGGDDK
jgi:hypothetical protein